MPSIINASSSGSGGIVQTADASGVLQLQSNGTTALTVSGSAVTLAGATTLSNTLQVATTIGVGGATPSASGAGITFPATQSASSDANTLDDYEEGSFTPTLGGTSTYAQQSGSYKKVGGLVYVSGILQVITLGTGSTSQMSGFPFTCSVGPRNTLSIGYWSGTVGSLAYLAFYVSAGSATTNTIATTAAASTVQDGYGVFQNGTYVIFSGCYHAS